MWMKKEYFMQNQNENNLAGQPTQLPGPQEGNMAGQSPTYYPGQNENSLPGQPTYSPQPDPQTPLPAINPAWRPEQPVPERPPKRGLSASAIALIVLSALLLLGVVLFVSG